MVWYPSNFFFSFLSLISVQYIYTQCWSLVLFCVFFYFFASEIPNITSLLCNSLCFISPSFFLLKSDRIAQSSKNFFVQKFGLFFYCFQSKAEHYWAIACSFAKKYIICVRDFHFSWWVYLFVSVRFSRRMINVMVIFSSTAALSILIRKKK